MTNQEAMRLLDEIRALAPEGRRADHEAAHIKEDELHLKVLRAIANGSAEDPVGLALLALQSQDIDFQRWCA